MVRFKLHIVIALTTLVIGCDQLVQDPFEDQQNLTFHSLSDLENRIHGIYGLMQSDLLFSYQIPLVLDIRSDDLKANSTAASSADIHEFRMNANHPMIRSIWRELYRAIRQCNGILAARFNFPHVASDINPWLAEARALRGYLYFTLCNLFAQLPNYSTNAFHPGVPLILSPTLEDELVRASVQSVYGQIQNDLYQSLTLGIADRGVAFVSTWAVHGLLARVHLYRNNYELAESEASEVLLNAPVRLTDRNIYLDTWRSGFVTDAIWKIENLSGDPPGTQILSRTYGFVAEYLPTNDLTNCIDSQDVRSGFILDNPGLDTAFGDQSFIKYSSPSGRSDIPLVKLSELLLTRAEARFYLGDITGAREDVSRVQGRALPGRNSLELEEEALLEAILQERRKELMLEGHRFLDLMRNGRAINRQDCNAENCFFPYPNDRFVLPIPADEIRLNPGIEQNPGY